MPCVLVEVMVSMPAMVENCFSSGVATDDAMVSGWRREVGGDRMVGKSTFGSRSPAAAGTR